MTVFGEHRSLKLAERHLRALQREHPGQEIHISSRRNARGLFSRHGHFFTFEIEEIEEFEEIELVGGFDSPGRKRK